MIFMDIVSENRISRTVTVFHGRGLPEAEMSLVGYAALADAYDLKGPLPEQLAAVGKHHRRYGAAARVLHQGWRQ